VLALSFKKEPEAANYLVGLHLFSSWS
jgi:hypothetical protein